MEGQVEAAAYKDVVLFLATAGIVVPLFRRWRISPILGFLGAGVLLGPYGLGSLADEFGWLSALTIDNPDQVAQLAEFGVVFLLFMIGLELSWERLRRMRRYVFGLGALQVGVCVAALAGAAHLFGAPLEAAIAIGAALALSSTAIVMPVLTEQKRQHAVAGRVTFSVLLFQDLAVAPILVALALFGRRAGEASASDLFVSFATGALGLLILLVFGRLLLRPMLRSVAKAKSEELFVAACLLVVIGAGLVSELTGLSMALGAFIAGLLLAETEYRHEVEVTIEPFKGLLLGLFFVSVGIRLNVPLLVEQPLPIIGAALGLILVNGAVVFGLARLFGLETRRAVESALLLAAGGEFAFVILSEAMGQGLVDRTLGESVLVTVTISMFAIPLLAAWGLKLGGRQVNPAEPPPEPDPAPDAEPRVLIAGYGRVGRLVGEMLRSHDIPWVAAESDPRIVEQARRAGETIFFGDASRAEFLQRCGLSDAPALVVTMDNPDGAEAIVATARGLRPDLTIVARARDARHAKRLYDLGATDAVPETVEASLQLSEALLVEIGVPMGLVIASIHERRDAFRAELNRPEALGGRTRARRQTDGA
ncbi:monovalent cation:proton antiporter-2 (CPA2) family protein [Phenylobacterium sp.]|uniref:monovalent cation:proton antiporter-2 (CPA2) family protein n=1 Tax=Phenylobacterium sp. TaxID=1871053 RepID=UPI002BC9F4C0|nr:monovalent cation:proton antiporter-2 (CPA2) family protein [Phenylobacterium sp.]HVI31144.1 monovalent cation:proton antiporter-2 (CPA2) family protein [Phenylobacterium sp.]